MIDRTAAVGLDPRSLACFRVGLALLVLVDLALRVPDVRAFYSDAGVLSRADLLEQYWFLHDAAFSVYVGAGGSGWVLALMTVQAVAALALLVGFRARTAAFACFVLVSGLQLRNLYVGEGYDALIRMFLLWASFAPTASCWSVDARGREPSSEPLHDVGSLAVSGQVIVVYLATGYAKYQSIPWRSGEALWLHLHTDFFVTRMGRWLGELPAVCAAITTTTMWAELLWPLAFLVPVARGPIRTAALAGMALLTLAFWLGIDVDLFPAAGAVGLSALLPAWFWDRVEPRWAGAREVAGSRLAALTAWLPPSAPPIRWATGAGQAAAAVLFAWVLVWNVGVARDPAWQGPAVGGELGRALFLQQAWAMFARPATRSGWVVVEGRTVGGLAVDLMRDGGPVPHVPHPSAIARGTGATPELPSAIYRSNRWRTLLRRIAYEEIEFAARGYSRYLCREWNAEHAGADRLDVLEIAFMNRPVPSPDGTPYQRDLVWEHGCFR